MSVSRIFIVITKYTPHAIISYSGATYYTNTVASEPVREDSMAKAAAGRGTAGIQTANSE